MRKFELWLDESGDFDNDASNGRRGSNPSLVGGLLIENNTFQTLYIDTIIPESGTYHSVNETDQLDRFRMIEERLFRNEANRFVVFSNQECIMVLDNNLTYLNVISEGILQLIKRLKAQYGEIFLRVIVANRVNTTTGLDPSLSVVQSGEYEKRLKEKIIVASLENSISDSEWILQTASARRDKRLMLADIVCNTFFTRNRRRKFNDADRSYIESIYTNDEKTLVFTVFESVIEKHFRNCLIDNRIGEAVSSICLSNDEAVLERCASLLKLNFNSRGVHDIHFEYQFVEAYIGYYINVVRDFDLCINFLRNLLKYYIPLLWEYDKSGLAEKLELDIKFYMLTVYTHMGNLIMADRMTEECEKILGELPTSMETINYRIKFETRKIANLINAFKYEEALKQADSQVQKCQGVKEILDLMSDDPKYYDELAKALGTRVQIKSFLLRTNPGLYGSAVEDSDSAINEFVELSDKKRQYLYRVHLETEHMDFDTALLYLKRSVEVPPETDEKALWEKVEHESVFAVNAYVRLMAEASACQWKNASIMYNAISNSSYVPKMEAASKLFHPSEIILWKYGYYYALNGMIKAAIKYYEKASEVCFSSTDLTLNLIGLGIEFEEHGILLKERRKEAAVHGKQLLKKWNKVHDEDKIGILENLFGKVDFQNDDYQYYMKLGRIITY